MNYTILEHGPLNASVRSLWLEGDTSSLLRPGQFVQAAVPGFYLRRPISVCDWTADRLRLVYKVIGPGTERLSGLLPGSRVDLIPGLGNGFDLSLLGDRPLLIGGGVGLPPLLGLCRALLCAGKRPSVLAGFAGMTDVFLLDDFRTLDVPVTVTTQDGSAGMRGLVTDALPGLRFDSIAACGPIPMMKAIRRAELDVPSLFSLEERMGCGFGACMGCSLETVDGPKRVCKEGPVFRGEELMWS